MNASTNPTNVSPINESPAERKARELREELQRTEAIVQEERARKAEEERKQKEAEAQRQRDAAIAARIEKQTAILSPIVAALRAEGINVLPNGNVQINGRTNHDCSVGLEEERDRISSFRSTPNGRYSVTIGQRYSGNSSVPFKRYPQKKDRTHSVDKIVAEVVSRVKWVRERDANIAELKERTTAAAELIATLRQEFPSSPLVLESEQYHNNLRFAPPPGHVYISLPRCSVRPETARKLLAAVNEVMKAAKEGK